MGAMAFEPPRGPKNRIGAKTKASEEGIMEKQRTPRQLQLEYREQQIAELAKKNAEYAYIGDKKYPDPGLPYRAWIQTIINENRI
jgi:hypothetical protein